MMRLHTIKFVFLSILIASIGLLSSPRHVTAQDHYTVQSGDTLSKIAQKVYGDASKWIWIYDANKALIQDKDNIKVGWLLLTPKTKPLSEKARRTAVAGKKPPIPLVTGNHYPPFADLKYPGDGMMTEIVELAFREMGYEYDLQVWGWKYGYEAAAQGEFAATFPYLNNPEREEQFLFSRPLYELVERWYVRQDAPISYNRPEDLAGLTVCRPEGYSVTNVREFLDTGLLTLKRAKELEDCFRMLEQQEVDIVVINELTGTAMIKHLYGSPDHFRVLEEPYSFSSLYFIVPKRYPGGSVLLQQFNNAISDMEKNGRTGGNQKTPSCVLLDDALMESITTIA